MQMQTWVRPQTYNNVSVDACWYTICWLVLFHMKKGLSRGVCEHYWITCTQQLDRIQMQRCVHFSILCFALDMQISSPLMQHWDHLPCMHMHHGSESKSNISFFQVRFKWWIIFFLCFTSEDIAEITLRYDCNINLNANLIDKILFFSTINKNY